MTRSSYCPLPSAVILFVYSALISRHYGKTGLNLRGRSHPPPRIVPGTWRVVFSSSGDLAPERAAVRGSGLRSRLWIEAARRPLRIALDSIAAVLFPSDCRVCNRTLTQLSRIPVCNACLNSLAPADVPACSVCGEALGFLSSGTEPLCGVCRRARPRFDFAISFGSYDGALRRLVHLLKYEQLRPVAVVLGVKLAEVLRRSEFRDDRPALAIPVPLHPSKRRQRGFNQSELIARFALKHLDRSCFELHSGNLRRTRATTSQTGLTRHQRRENVRGAFVVTAPRLVVDRSVVLVDDVYTTGTTLNECARVLRAAGAKKIAVATVARVYRSVAEIAANGISGQERQPVVVVEAAAG